MNRIKHLLRSCLPRILCVSIWQLWFMCRQQISWRSWSNWTTQLGKANQWLTTGIQNFLLVQHDFEAAVCMQQQNGDITHLHVFLQCHDTRAEGTIVYQRWWHMARWGSRCEADSILLTIINIQSSLGTHYFWLQLDWSHTGPAQPSSPRQHQLISEIQTSWILSEYLLSLHLCQCWETPAPSSFERYKGCFIRSAAATLWDPCNRPPTNHSLFWRQIPWITWWKTPIINHELAKQNEPFCALEFPLRDALQNGDESSWAATLSYKWGYPRTGNSPRRPVLHWGG